MAYVSTLIITRSDNSAEKIKSLVENGFKMEGYDKSAVLNEFVRAKEAKERISTEFVLSDDGLQAEKVTTWKAKKFYDTHGDLDCIKEYFTKLVEDGFTVVKTS